MLDAARIRFVYFDLDDTLLDHRKAERSALADCCSHYNFLAARRTFEEVHAIYHLHNARLWRAYGAGEISRAEVQRLRFQLLVDELETADLDAVELGNRYLSCYARHWTWRTGARDAFTSIAKHVPAGILTNGFYDIQTAKLERFPALRRLSRAVVISEEVGYLKPDRRIFDHAAERAGVEPEHLLYVGDSLHSDVEGGVRAGWQVAWLDGDAEHDTSAFTFSEWDDLLDILTPRRQATVPVAPETSPRPEEKAGS